MNRYITTRTVTTTECPWLDEDVPNGTLVYAYTDCTYGVVSSRGKAVYQKVKRKRPDGTTILVNSPFFELPRNSLEKL